MANSNFLRRPRAELDGSTAPARDSRLSLLLHVGASILLSFAAALTFLSRGLFGHGQTALRGRFGLRRLSLAVAGLTGALAFLFVLHAQTTSPTASSPSWPRSNVLLARVAGTNDARASLTVRFRPGTSLARQRRLLARFGAVETGTIPQLGLHVVKVAPEQARALLRHLHGAGSVASVAPDEVRQAAGTASGSAIASQWALQKIRTSTAVRGVTLKQTVRVAVLDTGVDAHASDLAGHLGPGYSALAGSTPTTDSNGHGTAMASLVLAAGPGARVLPVQVLDADGLGKDSDIIKGLVWAVDHRANVILMSFAGAGYSAALQAAIDYAWSKGVVVVAATGNAGSSTPTFPAGDAKVMGISATDQADHLWSGSNHGADTFRAAPGVGLLADAVGGGTKALTGTSASAALVAGSAALLLGSGRASSNAAVAGRLAASAHRAGTPDQTGNGRLDVARALTIKGATPLVPSGVRGRAAGGPFTGPYKIASAVTGPTLAGTNTGATAVSTLVVTLASSAVPVNSTIFVVAAQNGSSATPISAVDSGGNAYTNDADSNNLNGKHVAILRAKVTTALTTASTVTITFPLATAITKAATVFFVNGVVQTSPVDGTVGVASNNSAAAAATTGATSQAADFVVGGVTAATLGAASNSCTALASGTAGTSGTDQEFPVYKTVGATGTQTCGSAVTSGQWAAATVAYKIDGTQPTANVTGPSGNSWGYSGSITGTATDEAGGSGIDTTAGKTQLSIYDSTANKYWTGAAWSAVAASETYFNPSTGPGAVA